MKLGHFGFDLNLISRSIFTLHIYMRFIPMLYVNEQVS